MSGNSTATPDRAARDAVDEFGWLGLLIWHALLGVPLAIAWGLELCGGGWYWLGRVLAALTFIGFLFSFAGAKWHKCFVGIAITLVCTRTLMALWSAIFG